MLIAPLNDGWTEPDAVESQLAAVEQSIGARLPEDYRRFLQRFNGGYPYPNSYASAILRERDAAGDTLSYIEFFYDLSEMHAHWQGFTYGAGTPPGFAFIGNEPGGIEVLVSLRPQDFGVVYLWRGSCNIWSTDGNDEHALYRQAESFSAFLASLCDTPDQQGLEHWATPHHRATARNFHLPL